MREEEPDSLQLNFYAYMATAKYQKNIVKKSYFYLLYGKIINVPVLESDHDELAKIVCDTAKAIKNDKVFKPIKNEECKFCDYWSLCPLERKQLIT